LAPTAQMSVPSARAPTCTGPRKKEAGAEGADEVALAPVGAGAWDKAEVRAKEEWADHSGQARAGSACVRSAVIAPRTLRENL